MYYPYLYGRRSELLAIRDVAEINAADDSVAPVVEPVRADPGSLLLTLKKCESAELPVYVVANPVLGNFKNSGDHTKKWSTAYQDVAKKYACLRPTFLAHGNATAAELKHFVAKYPDEEIGVVLRHSAIEPDQIEAITAPYKKKRRFFLVGATPTNAVLSALGKALCVHVESRFIAQDRNSDYDGIESFTDSHLTYNGNGYAGFSDYTVLNSMYKEGGGPAGAIAIHLTFRVDKTGEIRVEHFLSDTQDVEIKNNNLKFMEALKYVQAAHAAARRKGYSFGITEAFQKYLDAYAASDPPDPGTNKRWEIAHHLDLMGGILSKRF